MTKKSSNTAAKGVSHSTAVKKDSLEDVLITLIDMLDLGFEKKHDLKERIENL